MKVLSEPASARDRLLRAAAIAFGAKGFHGTTTRDIASAAGMSPAAVYVHYRSKEDLLYAISHEGHEAIRDLLLEAEGATSDPRRQLSLAVHGFIYHHAEDHTVARTVNHEIDALSPEHRDEVQRIRREIDACMRRIVERGVSQGAFTAESPRLTSLALLSLGIDVARWYRDDRTWTPGVVADLYVRLALRLVGAP